MESVGFKLGYEMVAGEPESASKAREQYFDTILYLNGAALEAFEAAVKRGQEQAEQELKFEQ